MGKGVGRDLWGVAVSLLPAEFGDLERFAPWILETERERNTRRLSVSMEEIRDLYDTMKPRMKTVVAYLDKHPMDDMPEDAHRLLLLGFSLMEISNAVEMFGRQRPVEGFDAEQMVPIE